MTCPVGVVVRGDDETTDYIDGARDGDRLSVAVYAGGNREICSTGLATGDMVYRPDAITVLKLNLPDGRLPTEFTLGSVYPNPFNSRTSFNFGLPEACDVSLTLHDVNGRIVFRSAVEHLGAGWHRLDVDASGLPSSVYLAELSAGTGRITAKLVLLR